MTQVIMEIYEAFKDAGTSDEKAQKAASVISERLNRSDDNANTYKSELKQDLMQLEQRVNDKFSAMQSNLRIIMWMVGLIIITIVVPALKDFLN